MKSCLRLGLLVAAATVWCARAEDPPAKGAAGTVPCEPSPTRQWFIGVYHKTGTVLWGSIMRKMAHDGVQIMMSGAGWLCDKTTPYVPPIHDGPPHGMITRWNHASVASASEIDELVTWSRDAEAKEARFALFVRDPLELIMSGYFYHRHARQVMEPWLFWPVGTEKARRDAGHQLWRQRHKPCAINEDLKFTPLLDMECPVDGRALSGDIAADAACVAAARFRANESLSYHDLLNSVDPALGVALEGIRSLNAIRDINRTVALLRSRRDVGVFDLDAIVADANAYKEYFQDIFSFLGAVDRDACVDVAREFDVNENTQAGEGHAMSQEFEAMRAELTAVFKYNAWFTAVLEPLRRDLGYSA